MRIHGAIHQKAVIFIIAAVRIKNLKFLVFAYEVLKRILVGRQISEKITHIVS
jgi:hypothetical protein